MLPALAAIFPDQVFHQSSQHFVDLVVSGLQLIPLFLGDMTPRVRAQPIALGWKVVGVINWARRAD
jgi:hypothetical protein